MNEKSDCARSLKETSAQLRDGDFCVNEVREGSVVELREGDFFCFCEVHVGSVAELREGDLTGVCPVCSRGRVGPRSPHHVWVTE